MANRNTNRVGKRPAADTATGDTLKTIMSFVDRARACNEEPVERDGMAQINRHMKVLEEAAEFDKSLGPGLKVGRLVSWPQGDGKAYYFVTGVGPDVVGLEWIPGIDAWSSPVVQNGRALREAVEEAVRAIDGWRSIMARNRLKRKEEAK